MDTFILEPCLTAQQTRKIRRAVKRHNDVHKLSMTVKQTKDKLIYRGSNRSCMLNVSIEADSIYDVKCAMIRADVRCLGGMPISIIRLEQ